MLQTCIGHVLDCIETRARYGFMCDIDNKRMLLFPRLGAMSLDTPERVKYFGLQSLRACGICRGPRAGRSLTRSGTRHDPVHISRLYTQVNAVARTLPTIRERKRRREQLQRHGLNYTKRCRLTDHAKKCLVNIKKHGVTLFAGLVRYERMHIYFLGYCTYAMEMFVQLVPKEHHVAVHQAVHACHHFRDPITGATHPRLPSLLKLVHLTAERRVRAIFYWAHVLGTRADVIVEPCRVYVQGAVACLQLILIATRGHRPYTSNELNIIFKDVGRRFFVHMEQIATYLDDIRVRKAREKYNRDPENLTPPVPWQKQTR